MNTRPARKSEIELFANYSEADLVALETDLNHVPEGELPIQLALQEDLEAEVYPDTQFGLQADSSQEQTKDLSIAQ